ncbi:MAG: hypothetical protein ACYC5M_13630, partial [Anaerolineae bacterium]
PARVGMAGLVCWEWMRESARRGQVTTGVVTCPLCAKQWARAPKRHRTKICNDCASPNLRKVRKFRGDVL